RKGVILDGMIIENDGAEITGWQLPAGFDAGQKFLVSINARAFRIILPRAYVPYLRELETGTIVHITRENWQGVDAFKIMFDDGTEEPFTLQTDVQASDRIPWAQDSGRVDLQCSVWIDQGGPYCALRRPATYEDLR
ncbi:MAG: hypothetical protein O3C21_19485, partial [Verrucomicrobia bacterium]|nr:hypothetical protein [Verrucomicrobiota bacterium]